MLIAPSTRSTFRILAIMMLGSAVAFYSLMFYFENGLNLSFTMPFMAIQLAASITYLVTSYKKYHAGLRYQFILVLVSLFSTLVFLVTLILLGFSEPDMEPRETNEGIVIVLVGLVWIGSAVHYLTKVVAIM
jgi:hypothetical protein